MQRLAISLLLISMLSGCAGYQPKDIFAQSRGWLEKTSDQLEALSSPANNVNYDDEVEALLAQPYIDPLTDYINQHNDDEDRAEPLRQISAARKIRCQEIANKYATRPLTQESLNRYQAGYNYSCPKQVEAFALRLANVKPSEKIADSDTESPSLPEKTVLDEAIVLNVNKQQLNDCYLLTTISNFREAKTACLLPANRGDVRSQLNMAIIHKALANYSQSLTWAKKVEPESPRARYLIGELYASGLGVKQDAQMAFHWFEKAAEDDYADAQYMTAWSYETGIGVEQNIDKALFWYQRAALNNNTPAKHSLGALMVQQNKNPSSFIKGQNWLIEAVRAGYAESALMMGQIFQGNNSIEDKAKAVAWFEIAQQQGSAEAAELAQKLRNGINPDTLNSARQQIHRTLEGQE